MRGGELEEVEGPGAGDSLGAALHPQLAAEVIDVALHCVHTQHQATTNLAIGSPLQQQVQYLPLALGERFCKRTGASRGGRSETSCSPKAASRVATYPSLPDTFMLAVGERKTSPFGTRR